MEISFTDLVKLIHPDTNPNITNPSEKMSIVLRNRSNKKALYNLAVQWGVVQGTINQGVVIQGDVTLQVRTTVDPWDTGQRPVRRQEPMMTRREWERIRRVMEVQIQQQLRRREAQRRNRSEQNVWDVNSFQEPQPQPQPQPQRGRWWQNII